MDRHLVRLCCCVGPDWKAWKRKELARNWEGKTTGREKRLEIGSVWNETMLEEDFTALYLIADIIFFIVYVTIFY
jgi:hypothetical protein